MIAAALILLGAPSLSDAVGDEVGRFAHAPRLAMPHLSPDGRLLSFVEQSLDRQFVIIRPIEPGPSRRVLELHSARERVRWCDWSGSTYLLCGTISPLRLRDRMAERTRLYAVDARTGTVRELNTQLDDLIRDQVIDLVPDSARKVVIQHDADGRGYPEAAELDVSTGVLRRLVHSRPPVRRWLSDGRGNVGLGVGFDHSVATLHVRRGEDWPIYLEQSLADLDALGPIALSPTDRLYALKHQGGRAALFQIDLNSAAPAPVLMLADPLYDIAGPLTLDAKSGTPLAAQYVAQTERVHAFDREEAQRMAAIEELLPGTINLIVDRSVDNQRMLVLASSDVSAPTLHVFDASTHSLVAIGEQFPRLAGRRLAPMQATAYRARDGQVIPAYLTLPPSGASAGLPAVVLPHGGPESRNWKAFDPLVQFLAAEGYAVLQMNFRGSFGYGARFAALGAGQWGGVIHNDITDGTRWLVESGVADPARICIVGASFGGYAALLAAARESEWYACAVSYAGVSDLLALSQYTQRLLDADVWRERLGSDARALWQASPIAHARTVATPVLMIHGRLDPTSPVRQMRRFVRALHKADKAHRYVERADCDHEMTVESCRLAFFAELQRFLAAALNPDGNTED